MKNQNHFALSAVAALGAAVMLAVGSPDACAGSVFGVDVADYIILYEGGGAKTLSINNFGTLLWTGDIGIAGTGYLATSGPGTVDGNVNFAGSTPGRRASATRRSLGR